MVQDQDKYNKLYDAAEAVYKFFEDNKGFYSGSRVNEVGKKIPVFNEFRGARGVIEAKLKRPMNPFEVTILALAVGNGPTKVLTEEERKQAYEDLWENKPNKDHLCLTFNRLVTCI